LEPSQICTRKASQVNGANLAIVATSDETAKNMFRKTSLLIQKAVMVYFYTSLTPETTYKHDVQGLVREAIHLLEQLFSQLRSQHLWPTFITALFVHEDTDRLFVLDAFDKISQESPIFAIGSAMRAKHIAQAVWKKRDLRSKDKVTHPANDNSWKSVVRQMSDGLSLG